MESSTDLSIPSRGGKPRATGLTIITDFGPDAMGWMGLQGTADFLEVAGPYVDGAKMQAANVAVLRESAPTWIKNKIDIYRQHSVQVYIGGIMSEIALLQGRIDHFFGFVRDLGFDAFELSENLVSLESRNRKAIISRAVQEGFQVIYEFGRKYADSPLALEAAERAIKDALDAGSKRVVLERFEIDVLRDHPATLVQLVERVGMQNLILEADPAKFPQYHVWLIDTLGCDVSIGNVAPGHVLRLEQFRRGLGIPVGYRFLREGRSGHEGLEA